MKNFLILGLLVAAVVIGAMYMQQKRAAGTAEEIGVSIDKAVENAKSATDKAANDAGQALEDAGHKIDEATK